MKVKYGEKNGEVYAEVAASRLLWALGFQADVMYPSRVTCRGCPADPFAVSGADWGRGKPKDVSTKEFDPAVIERESGSAVEVPGYEGWAWPELDKISATLDRRHARAARCVQAARGVHPAFGFEAGPAGDRLPGRRASARTRRATRPAPRRGW